MKTTVDLDSLRSEHESDEQWEVRKNFMLEHRDKFEEAELITLAQLFTNIEFLGCRYSPETMSIFARLKASKNSDTKTSHATNIIIEKNITTNIPANTTQTVDSINPIDISKIIAEVSTEIPTNITQTDSKSSTTVPNTEAEVSICSTKIPASTMEEVSNITQSNPMQTIDLMSPTNMPKTTSEVSISSTDVTDNPMAEVLTKMPTIDSSPTNIPNTTAEVSICSNNVPASTIAEVSTEIPTKTMQTVDSESTTNIPNITDEVTTAANFPKTTPEISPIPNMSNTLTEDALTLNPPGVTIPSTPGSERQTLEADTIVASKAPAVDSIATSNPMDLTVPSTSGSDTPPQEADPLDTSSTAPASMETPNTTDVVRPSTSGSVTKPLVRISMASSEVPVPGIGTLNPLQSNEGPLTPGTVNQNASAVDFSNHQGITAHPGFLGTPNRKTGKVHLNSRSRPGFVPFRAPNPFHIPPAVTGPGGYVPLRVPNPFHMPVTPQTPEFPVTPHWQDSGCVKKSKKQKKLEHMADEIKASADLVYNLSTHTMKVLSSMNIGTKQHPSVKKTRRRNKQPNTSRAGLPIVPGNGHGQFPFTPKNQAKKSRSQKRKESKERRMALQGLSNPPDFIHVPRNGPCSFELVNQQSTRTENPQEHLEGVPKWTPNMTVIPGTPRTLGPVFQEPFPFAIGPVSTSTSQSTQNFTPVMESTQKPFTADENTTTHLVDSCKSSISTCDPGSTQQNNPTSYQTAANQSNNRPIKRTISDESDVTEVKRPCSVKDIHTTTQHTDNGPIKIEDKTFDNQAAIYIDLTIDDKEFEDVTNTTISDASINELANINLMKIHQNTSTTTDNPMSSNPPPKQHNNRKAPPHLCILIINAYGQYINKKVTDIITNEIEQRLIQEALTTDNRSLERPEFLGRPIHAKGKLLLFAADEYTVNWLKQQVTDIPTPPNIKLAVRRQSDFSRVKCGIAIPIKPCVINETDISHILNYQNPWAEIDRWDFLKLYRRKKHWFVHVLVPGDLVEVILGRGRRMAYLTGAVYLHVMQNKNKNKGRGKNC